MGRWPWGEKAKRKKEKEREKRKRKEVHKRLICELQIFLKRNVQSFRPPFPAILFAAAEVILLPEMKDSLLCARSISYQLA